MNRLKFAVIFTFALLLGIVPVSGRDTPISSSDHRDVPYGWNLVNSRADAASIETGRDPGAVSDGVQCYYLEYTADAANGSILILQSCLAEKFEGAKIRFSAVVKFGPTSDVGLSLLVDGAPVTSTPASSRTSQEPTGVSWRTLSIEASVPVDAKALGYEISLRGRGKVWIRQAKLEVLQDPVHRTHAEAPIDPAIPASPINLDFQPYVHLWLVQLSRPENQSSGAFKEQVRDLQAAASTGMGLPALIEKYKPTIPTLSQTDLGWSGPSDLKPEYTGMISQTKPGNLSDPVYMDNDATCLLFYVDSRR